jgi:hypothetical protein
MPYRIVAFLRSLLCLAIASFTAFVIFGPLFLTQATIDAEEAAAAAAADGDDSAAADVVSPTSGKAKKAKGGKLFQMIATEAAQVLCQRFFVDKSPLSQKAPIRENVLFHENCEEGILR